MTSAPESVRTAELAAALCLGTDLGMGLPFEHGLRGTIVAMRLAERLGVDAATASQTYYVSLLSYSGCTTDAEANTATFAGSLTTHVAPAVFGSEREMLAGVLRALAPPQSRGPARAVQVARRLPRAARERDPHLAAICEVGQMLAERLGLPASVHEIFVHLTERWDGRGRLRRARGEQIPLALRIAHVGRDATLQATLGGDGFAAQVIGARAGGAFDPEVAACFVENAGEILASAEDVSAWEETLACEPAEPLVLSGDLIDPALAAIGDFADLVSPWLTGHSAGVARLAGAAAERCGLDSAQATRLRRAGHVHDLGRVAVHPRVWQKAGPPNPDEWEQVRLHAYHTERVLCRSPFLAGLAPLAGAHHERLDGSGYHRGATAAQLPMTARLLATADAYQAMTEPRAHREALPAEQAAERLAEEARAGRLDAAAVTAVVEAAGQRAPHLARPAGLTEREAEVVAMLARGLQTKQVARRLGISPKTADRHVQSSYRKIGVSTRAGVTLFAMEHGLVGWGELPIARPGVRA